MKSMLMIVSLVLLAAQAFAAAPAKPKVTHFSCETDDVIEGKRVTKIKFGVEGLGTKNAAYAGDENTTEPVITSPKDSVLDLNDNFGIAQEADRLHMTSDGDGCTWTDFVLWTKTDYKTGYVRLKDGGCGVGARYSSVTCTVKAAN